MDSFDATSSNVAANAGALNSKAAAASFAQPNPPAGRPLEAELESQTIAEARRVLKIEADAILDMRERLSSEFDRAIELLLKCAGKVVVTGMGKSGHVGVKI